MLLEDILPNLFHKIKMRRKKKDMSGNYIPKERGVRGWFDPDNGRGASGISTGGAGSGMGGGHGGGCGTGGGAGAGAGGSGGGSGGGGGGK